MPYPIDMHIHSCYSIDGELSPAELVEKCAQAGITLMAVSDHNCVKAIPEARQEARRRGIGFVSAVELDCTFCGVNLHVLGYHIDDKDPAFAALEASIMRQEIAASQHRLRATREILGFPVTEEALRALAAPSCPNLWTGETFAEALLTDPSFRGHAVLAPYRSGGDRSDNPYVNFYWDYYAQGKPCYGAVTFPSLEETIQLIHRTGGKAILAHPGNNLKNRRHLLAEMIPLGLDGLEAFCSYHTAEDSAWFSQEALRMGLFVTCGSDFHGKIKPAVILGGIHCPIDPAALRANLSPLMDL